MKIWIPLVISLTGANEQPGSEGTLGNIKDKLGGILGNGGNDQSTTGENSEQRLRRYVRKDKRQIRWYTR